jgi:hypothetical protein
MWPESNIIQSLNLVIRNRKVKECLKSKKLINWAIERRKWSKTRIIYLIGI